MARTPIPTEGTVFLVPLTPSGFAAGVLARANRKGGAFGYFFGPQTADIAKLDLASLVPANAALVCRFGDYGLRTGRWALIGQIPDFDRGVWSLPRFRRPHDSQEQAYVTEYDDSLSRRGEKLVPIESAEIALLPHDAQFGSEIVEHNLSKLLGPNRAESDS